MGVDHAGALRQRRDPRRRGAGRRPLPQSLRHRYGTVGYQRIKDPRALADLMGHASVATTMSFYAAAADEAAAAIADAVVDE
ncbi:site-specific integrase [Nocardioides sp. W3-2-3]|nr:site-specific integrase [Nocardioides convexus]